MVYGINGDSNVKINANYRLEDNILGFNLEKESGAFERLVIDPTLEFCTYTGSTINNYGFTATHDLQGNLYAGGVET